ncbi:MAG: Rieske (2Fe-2S) protein [Rhodospirillales bacterium]|jgi:nitrite reductase/ring-hydroxylating ferredoxin subunit|nr:Rieske (2Fe-2S) protein [Rhodospirillales bacterium]
MTDMTALCRLTDIEDGGSQRFTADIDGKPSALLAVRAGKRVFVYVNSCPHVGAPLDMIPGKFLNAEGTHIQCANHGALFSIENGNCVRGPCVGDALKPVSTLVSEGFVYLER